MVNRKRRPKSPVCYCCLLAVVAGCVVLAVPSLGLGARAPNEAKQGRILAQKVLEDLVSKHSELQGMEVAATPSGKTCVTIAATESKEVGADCDNDEYTAIKTNKPFVEKENEGGKEVFDITAPLHDSSGKVMGTIGMDFKPEPGQERAKVVRRAEEIVREFGFKPRRVR
jgi:hypothetical protein